MNPTEEKSTSSVISDDQNSGKKDDHSSDASKEKSTTLKKPDKIIPCPRCNSMDTKFCYYNNYNVNQPRHFCKNCQRYWTSGGTMRNVAVGSGRRKNKNTLLPNYPHIEVVRASDAASHLSSLKPNAFLISSPGFPVSFYPTTLYWGSAPNMSLADPPPRSMSSGSVLGKHLRGKENLEAERTVLIPKTLKIHDPNEAAKSSIWSTLGIKNETVRSLNGASLFKAFESKGDRQSNVDHRAMVLQANPAAFCRSLNFHESS